MQRIAVFAVVLGYASAQVRGQSAPDLSAVHQIKTEAFQNSKVMDHLEYLSDLYGPRLTASPEWQEAAQWAMKELKSYGVENVHEEKWGPFGRSWSVESYTADMIAPRYSHLVAAPLAWSSSTNGPETADALYAPLTIGRWYEFKKNRENLEKYKTEWHGKLKGKVVLLTELKETKAPTTPVFTRYTDAQLADIAKAPTPAIRRNLTIDQVDIPSDPKEAEKYLDTLPNELLNALYEKYDEFSADLGALLKEEGALAVFRGDRRSHDGILNAEDAGSYSAKRPMAPPTFVVTDEQYSRMVRLLQKKVAVNVRFELRAKVSSGDVDAANILGEIPGKKKPNEVVMIGAHFDSWHSGTGAIDNGAGSAVMMEVMRILKKLNLPMDRTVRIGLWSGEEQGLFGSRAYIKMHFADVKTAEIRAEHSQLDAYLNLDNGSGKIRGIYLENNDAARPLFEAWLAPFRDLDVTTISMQRTFGTDHQSFDDAGLPGFQFIQDPLDYETLTHHSDVDTYSHAVEEDLMQASAVIASLVYDIANREEMVPRKSIVKDGKLLSY